MLDEHVLDDIYVHNKTVFTILPILQIIFILYAFLIYLFDNKDSNSY